MPKPKSTPKEKQYLLDLAVCLKKWRPNNGTKVRVTGRNEKTLPSVGNNLNRPIPSGGKYRDNDKARWKSWHAGIADAPEFPTSDRIDVQRKCLEYLAAEMAPA